MIAIARSWHIPARYVSGYLYVDGPEGQETLPTASHAWGGVPPARARAGWALIPPTGAWPTSVTSGWE